MTTKSIEILVKELAVARDAAHEADNDRMRAGSRATQRQKELNDVQRAIDDWYEEQRKDAPDGSHWVSKR